MRHADLLAQIPLFQGLSDSDLEALAAKLDERRFKQGDLVFTKGDFGSSMYVVLSGGVQIFLPGDGKGGEEVLLKEARAGEYFGELSLFDAKPRSASVRAVTDAVLLELTRSDLADHLARSPASAMTILSEMSERIRVTNVLLSQRAAKDVQKEIDENLTWGQRLADKVADWNGSWGFILVIFGLTLLWSLFNLMAGKNDRGEWQGWDPYPFQFYNLFLAVLVALQGPLIVMSQNRQSLKDRRQAETDFRVNLKNEVGIEHILSELGAFRADAVKRLDLLERSLRAGRVRTEVASKVPGAVHGATAPPSSPDSSSKIPRPPGSVGSLPPSMIAAIDPKTPGFRSK